jgi:hypothetical protein
MSLYIDIDNSAIDQIISMTKATAEQIEKARLSAMRKLGKRIETIVKRKAAKELRIPQKSIENRFFAESLKPGDETLKIWVGTWDLSPFALGAPSVYGLPGKSGGVKAGNRTYPGAFMAKIYTSRDHVWIRVHSPHYSADLYPTRYRPGDRGLGELAGRFPVVRAAVPIDDTIRSVVGDMEKDFSADFEKTFFGELNYFANIRGNRQ